MSNILEIGQATLKGAYHPNEDRLVATTAVVRTSHKSPIGTELRNTWQLTETWRHCYFADYQLGWI